MALAACNAIHANGLNAIQVGSVPLSGIPRSMVIYQNGSQQLAYVCADAYINIVDVTQVNNPGALSTFAHDILTTEDGAAVSGYQSVSCSLDNNLLLVAYSRYDGNTTSNPIPTHFATYSLANPMSPVELGSVVDIPRSDSAGFYVAGNTGLLYQSDVLYDTFTGYIDQQNGDIWTADLSNVAITGSVTFLNDVFSCGTLTAGQCSNVTNVTIAGPDSCAAAGTTPVPNDPTKGGPYRIFPGTAVNGSTWYFGSSSSAGANSELPGCPPFDGQLLVVDTTNRASPAITSRVDAPAMAYLTDVALNGNTAIAVGDSAGIYNVFSGFVGTLVIASFDLGNPTSPTLLASVVTPLTDQPGAYVISLGQGLFGVGNASNGGSAEFVVVDATNPTALNYMPFGAPQVGNLVAAQNRYVFALSGEPSASSNTLSIFQLPGISPSGPISPSPASLNFSASYQGATPASQPVNVTSAASGIAFTVTSDSPWLSGGVAGGVTPQQLAVTATPGTLAPGTYNGNLTLASGTYTSKVGATLTISESGSRCDVNQDGMIDALDTKKLLGEALGTIPASNGLTSGGILSVVDIQIDLNAALGLGCSVQ